jgi:iron complex outermembrane receptor protein
MAKNDVLGGVMTKQFLKSTSMRAISASLLSASFAMAASAAAQTVPETGSPTAPPVAERSATGSGSEIVVTANKRDQNLMDVPIQVTVVTSQDLTDRGITQASQLLGSTPNVTFMEDNAGEAYINIRGQTAVRASDPNVAIVIDGVVLTSTKAFNRNIFGIEQIEIVKGPQTALYGRNAAAGAIVITTKRPGDRFEGEFVGSYGNFNTFKASAAISGPLTDTLGFSVAAATYNTDGPFKSANAEFSPFEAHNNSIRGRLFYDNGENLTVDLKFDYFKVTGAGISYNAQFVGIPIGDWPGDALDISFVEQPFISNIRGINDNQYKGASLNINYDLGFADFTAISGINRYDEYWGGDGIPYLPNTGSGAALGAITSQYVLQDDNLSQEIRLTSKGDQRLRWQVGATFLQFDRKGWNKTSEDNLGALSPDPRIVDPPSYPSPTIGFVQPVYTTKNYAAFGNFEFDIMDQLTLAVAGRYDIEKRTVTEVAPLAFNQCVIQNNIPLSECNNQKTFKEFSPKVTLTFRPTEESSIYASYGKGFKSGGFNPIGSRNILLDATPPEFQDQVYVQDIYLPEISKSFEIGGKLQLLDRRLFLTAAAFQTKVDGAQQFAFFPSRSLQTVVSIDKVELKGFDFSADWRSTGGTTLNFGFGYVDGTVTEFAGNPAAVGNIAAGSAEYTLSIAGSQEFDLTPELKLVPRLEFTKAGRMWSDADNTPGTLRPPISLLNGRVTLKSTAGWQLAGYVDNITNEKYYQVVVPLLSVLSVQYRGWTRSFGVEARYEF